MTTPILLHGCPLEAWIGRRVKLNSRDAPGNARKPAKVIAFDEKRSTATVHPGGHKGTVEVLMSAIHPWWQHNDDLRRKYKVTEPDPVDASLDESDRLIWEARQQQRIKPTVHETNHSTPPLPAGPDHIPRQPSRPAPHSPAPEDVRPPVLAGGPQVSSVHPQEGQAHGKEQTMTRTIKHIVINPNASATWMDDYKALQEAMSMVKAREDAVVQAVAHLEHAKETVETFIAALDGNGVTIEWDEPEVDPTYEDRRRDPNPLKSAIQSNELVRKLKSEAHISEIDLARVRRFRTSLVSQMVTGRQYNRTQILDMLKEEDTPTNQKIITYTFRGHSRLTFKRGGGGTPGVYFIIA